MHRIVPGIASLEQHFQTLLTDPEQYRPAQCPHCGRGDPWNHGRYERKANRGAGELNPIAVPRFFCYKINSDIHYGDDLYYDHTYMIMTINDSPPEIVSAPALDPWCSGIGFSWISEVSGTQGRQCARLFVCPLWPSARNHGVGTLDSTDI